MSPVRVVRESRQQVLPKLHREVGGSQGRCFTGVQLRFILFSATKLRFGQMPSDWRQVEVDQTLSNSVWGHWGGAGAARYSNITLPFLGWCLLAHLLSPELSDQNHPGSPRDNPWRWVGGSFSQGGTGYFLLPSPHSCAWPGPAEYREHTDQAI